jgi:plastocyanin
MRNISSRRFVEAGRRLFGTIGGTALLVALVLIGGRQSFAKEEPKTHVVVMEGMKFAPSALRVGVGDRIEFKNADLVPHTATAKRGGGFDSGLVKPGESWVLVPRQPGTFDYTCTFHPMMMGKLTVDGT